MIFIQIVSRDGTNLQSLLRRAIKDGKIRSFHVVRVQGGLRVQHRKHLGELSFLKSPGPAIVSLKCHNRSKEWQLLEAFVGRIAYHFKNEVAGINIQLEPETE